MTKENRPEDSNLKMWSLNKEDSSGTARLHYLRTIHQSRSRQKQQRYLHTEVRGPTPPLRPCCLICRYKSIRSVIDDAKVCLPLNSYLFCRDLFKIHDYRQVRTRPETLPLTPNISSLFPLLTFISRCNFARIEFWRWTTLHGRAFPPGRAVQVCVPVRSQNETHSRSAAVNALRTCASDSEAQPGFAEIVLNAPKANS